jgi:ABC-type nitrate/sulfonate/bicarbonate transport system permease component
MIIGSVKILKEGMEPLVAVFFSIPKVLLIPIFWSIFGFSFEYKVAYSFIHGLPPILLNVIAMTTLTEESHLKVAKLYGASRLQLYQKIILPSITFGLLSSLRLALNLCLIGVIIAEMFVGTTGLGFALRQYASTFKIPEFYAIIYLLASFSVSINIILLGFERRIITRRGLRTAVRVL